LSNDEAVWLIAGDFFKASVLILPVLEIKVRDETFSPGVSTCFPKNDYAIGISNSWRSENQRIDDTEDGSVAPIPRARVSTATIVNAGCRRRLLMPY